MSSCAGRNVTASKRQCNGAKKLSEIVIGIPDRTKVRTDRTLPLTEGLIGLTEASRHVRQQLTQAPLATNDHSF